jgi:hypothetical protein
MILEWLAELKNQVDKHGIRWGMALTLYAIYRKERRNYRLDQRDILHNAYFAAILANQRLILKAMGREDEWDAGKSSFPNATEKVSSLYLRVATFLAPIVSVFTPREGINNYKLLRRETKMPNINKAMLGPIISTLLLIIKTATGYDIPLPWADMMVDFILSVYTIYGFFLHPTGEPIIGRINKALIMPIFAMVFLIISLFTHHPVANDLVSSLADFVVYALTLWGQFMHPVTLPQATAPNSKNFIQG